MDSSHSCLSFFIFHLHQRFFFCIYLIYHLTFAFARGQRVKERGGGGFAELRRGFCLQRRVAFLKGNLSLTSARRKDCNICVLQELRAIELSVLTAAVFAWIIRFIFYIVAQGEPLVSLVFFLEISLSYDRSINEFPFGYLLTFTSGQRNVQSYRSPMPDKEKCNRKFCS